MNMHTNAAHAGGIRFYAIERMAAYRLLISYLIFSSLIPSLIFTVSMSDDFVILPER